MHVMITSPLLFRVRAGRLFTTCSTRLALVGARHIVHVSRIRVEAICRAVCVVWGSCFRPSLNSLYETWPGFFCKLLIWQALYFENIFFGNYPRHFLHYLRFWEASFCNTVSSHSTPQCDSVTCPDAPTVFFKKECITSVALPCLLRMEEAS